MAMIADIIDIMVVTLPAFLFTWLSLQSIGWLASVLSASAAFQQPLSLSLHLSYARYFLGFIQSASSETLTLLMFTFVVNIDVAFSAFISEHHAQT